MQGWMTHEWIWDTGAVGSPSFEKLKELRPDGWPLAAASFREMVESGHVANPALLAAAMLARHRDNLFAKLTEGKTHSNAKAAEEWRNEAICRVVEQLMKESP